TRDDAMWWLNEGCKNGITLAIEHEGKFAGGIGAIPNQHEKRFSAAVGYWLGEPFWGKGIATQALKLFTEELFATTPLVRLYAGVYTPNTASMRVLEKAGYHREAILAKAAFKNGVFYDEYVFAKVKG